MVHSALDAEPPRATAFKVHGERLHSSVTAVQESIRLQLSTRSKISCGSLPLSSLVGFIELLRKSCQSHAPKKSEVHGGHDL